MKLLIGLVFALFTTQAHASILFGPSIGYWSTKTTDQTGFLSTTNSSTLSADGKLGLLIEGTIFYIGGMYSYQSDSTDAVKMTGGYYGPSLGIFNGAFALIGTYILNGDRTYKQSGADYKLSNATGFRVDMSYVAGLTGSIGIGPQLTYRDIKYAKSTAPNAAETSNSYQESGVYPSIVFWFRW